MNQYVHPNNTSGAKICFILDWPNEEQASQSTPFAGNTRNYLTRLLAGTGLGAGDYSINYLVKRCPNGGDNDEAFRGDFYKSIELPTYTKTGKISKKVKVVQKPTEEYLAYIQQLKEEIYEQKPNIIVAMGEEVLRTLCSTGGILSYRGSVMESTLVPGCKVVPVPSPRWVITSAQWEYLYVTINDLKKVIYEAEFSEIRRDNFESIIAPGLDYSLDYLHRLISEPSKRWSFDIETRAGSIACLGFCYDDQALCIPLQTTQGPYWTVSEEALIWKKVGEVFQSNPNLIGQNLTYDLDWIMDYGVESSGVFLDTMIGQFILAPEMQKGLDYICSLYTDALYYKDEGKTWSSKIPDEQLWKYNCKDTYYTLKASYGIETTLKNQGMWSLWEDYGRKLIPIALEIQKRGLAINQKRRDEVTEIILSEYNALRPEVVKAVGFEINVNSPVGVQQYLRNGLGLPLRKKRGTGKSTADEDALMGFLVKPLSKQAQKKVHPQYKEILTLIMKERHLRKAGSYCGIKIKSGGEIESDPLFSDNDNIVRSSNNITGTKTWRFSMSASPHGTGWNLQTAPKQLRFYDSPKGRIFLQPDQKQAEARVVAWKAGCKKQIELFNDPSRSIHLEFGSTVFKKQLSKDTPEYTAAKSGVHGGNFRMMAERLAKTTGIDIGICEMAIEGYHKLYPEIRFNYHNKLKDMVLRDGYLENPFGLRRYFYHAIAGVTLTGKLSNDDWNDICSWIPQSTIPFITNLTLMRVCDKLDYIWIHQQGHDAFLISVPIGCEEETSNLIFQEGSKIKSMINGRELIIPWEMQMGYRWDVMYEEVGKFSYRDWESHYQSDVKAGKLGTREKIIKGIYGIL